MGLHSLRFTFILITKYIPTCPVRVNFCFALSFYIDTLDILIIWSAWNMCIFWFCIKFNAVIRISTRVETFLFDSPEENFEIFRKATQLFRFTNALFTTLVYTQQAASLLNEFEFYLLCFIAYIWINFMQMSALKSTAVDERWNCSQIKRFL